MFNPVESESVVNKLSLGVFCGDQFRIESYSFLNCITAVELLHVANAAAATAFSHFLPAKLVSHGIADDDPAFKIS